MAAYLMGKASFDPLISQLTSISEDIEAVPWSAADGLNNLAPDGNFQHLVDDINAFFQNVSSDLAPIDRSLTPDDNGCFPEEFIIEPHQVETKLARLNPHKAGGPDDIPNWFWRDFSIWLAEPLCFIFNCSLHQGTFPSIWKQANVTPVPKISVPVDITKDLRPISLTCTIQKFYNHSLGNGLSVIVIIIFYLRNIMTSSW